MQSLTMLRGELDNIWLFAALNEASSQMIAQAGVEVLLPKALGFSWPGSRRKCADTALIQILHLTFECNATSRL